MFERYDDAFVVTFSPSTLLISLPEGDLEWSVILCCDAPADGVGVKGLAICANLLSLVLVARRWQSQNQCGWQSHWKNLCVQFQQAGTLVRVE